MTTLVEMLGLAVQQHLAGNLPQAEQLYRHILQQDPHHADALHLLGVVAHQGGNYGVAIEHISQALRLRPDFAAAHSNLGLALLEQGQLAQAEASLLQAVRLQPDSAEAHNHLGNVLQRQGKVAEAVASFLQALRLKPEYVEAHHNLGIALRAQGKLAEAEASLQQALRFKPDHAYAYLNLGNVLRAQGRLDEAIAAYHAALQLKGDFAEAHNNIGNVLKDQGRLDDAIAAYRTSLQLRPDAADTHSNLVYVLVFHPGYDAGAIQQECRHWNQQHAEPLKRLIQPHGNHRDPQRRLRIGYVSPDFRDHAESFFTIPLLSHHDHRQCEIFCYANIFHPDAVTKRLRGYADVWRNTVGLSDQEVADLVRKDQIDILVDLAMHMANSRLLVFARKPAPVQVAWLAYPGTTGLATMDYRLTDPYLDPRGLFDAFYAEESFRLPDTFACYDPLTDQPQVNLLPALGNGFTTFSSFNNFCKINDGCLALWAKVLEAVPRSRLLLLAPRGQAREHVLARLEQEGVVASRVEFADKLPRLDYLKLYQRIDLGLDPLPYNGITTSLDAFWMGVPTLTLLGKTVVGRAGWSQLCNLGLTELAAETPEQYVALAAQLASDLPRLQELRGTLRQRMQRSPLMDGNRFARHMEQAYRQMWRRWCQKTKPAEASTAISPDQSPSRQANDTPKISVPQALQRAWKHFQEGQLHEAEQLYLQILQVDPNQVDALHLLGLIAGQTGRNDLAIAYLKATLRLKPDFAGAHNNLGNVFTNQKKLPEAAASFQQAVRFKPDYAVAHNNLGNALREQGKLAEAVASLEQALRLKPDYAEAHFNLGLALQGQGKLGEAEASFQQAVRLKPDYAEAHIQLGVVLGKQGKYEQATASHRRAVHFKPEHAEAHFNLGIALEQQGKLDAAAASYQQVLRLEPDNAETHCKLGHVRKDQGRLDDAIAAYRSALRLKPDEARFHSSLVVTLNMHPDFDAAAIFGECQSWNRQHAEPLKRFTLPHTNFPDPDRKLRIGYVSSDFREHPTSAFTIPLLSNHDHGQCEIFCYANVARPDTLTERLRGHADGWRSTVGLSDQQVADLIRSDHIDILVDLAMHTVNNRLLIFARKPAPIQVAWLAYPGTTGLSTMDYRLTDPCLDPPGLFDSFYSEESLRLPETFWCYDPLTDQPPVNALPALKNGFITFGCLNYFPKINEGVLALWAKVLQAVQRSRLLLVAPQGQARELVLAKLQQYGIAASRVDFVERQPRLDYLKLYHRIDLGLDPLPCNGGTTTLDAFWMGVPTLTLVGQTVVGRAGWSLVCNLGLKELAAETPEQYAALVAEVASDLPRLQELRGTLRQRLQRSPLMDGKRFARHVEQAYRDMWRRWCQQAKPAGSGAAIAPDQPTAGQGNDTGTISVPQLLALAMLHHEKGNLRQAELLYGQILQADPRHVDALHLLGLIAHHGGRHAAAIEQVTRALSINPDFALAHSNLGVILRAAGKFEEAAASFREAVRLQPDSAPALNNLGEALTALPDQGRLTEAVAIYQQALRLQPDFAEAHNNLGIALHKQGRLEEAKSSYQQALRCSPAFAEAHNNLGGALSALGKREEAQTGYEQAIRCKPDYADAHMNRAMGWLLLGDFEQGWPEFEWRWQTKDAAPPSFPRMPWDGSALAERTILLHAELGLGDTIQFVRYASLVKQQGGDVLLRCPQALLRLLSKVRGIDRLIPERSPLPAFDVDAPLLSLPKVFATTLATIPAEIPYLFADPDLTEHWRRELDRYRGFRIGIAWQGNPKHKNDRQRSIPLAYFAPVAGLGGVQLFSLQKGPGHEQLAQLAESFAVVDLGSRLDDFMDTAAVMKNLDLVISVDSAVAHLGGALGVPVWVALPFMPDWRWLLLRDDSPWYPTMRLFRQGRRDDWLGVFERIGGEVQRLLAVELGPRVL